MLILQAGWLENRLQIWGEVAPGNAAAPPDAQPAGGQRTANHHADLAGLAASPFDAGASLLGKVVEALAESRATARMRHVRPAAAWLPSRRNWPIPSHKGFLPLDWPMPKASEPLPEMAPWRVSVLPLSWIETCALLSACSNGPVLGRRLHVGRSLIVWSCLWRYAGALVARQSYLPHLVAVDGTQFESRWHPVLDTDDRQRFHALARELPPAAVCLSLSGGAPGALHSAARREAVARDFLEQAVDRLVRSAVTTPLTRAQALKGLHSGAHAAWLASLRGDGRRVRWDSAEDLQQLATALAAWRRPLVMGHAADCRLVFRLVEPGDPQETDARWWLTASVKQARGSGAWSLWHLEDAPPIVREYGLTALGQAITLCPCLRARGAEATEQGVPLDTGEAYNFLSHDIAVLRAAGYEVEPPAWWRDQGDANPVRLRVLLDEAYNDPDSFTRLGLDQLVEVNWTLVLGDHAVTSEQLKDLLSGDEPLIRWQGRWMAIDRVAANAAIRQLKERRGGRMTLRDMLKLTIGGGMVDGVRIDTGDFGTQGASGDLMRRLRGETGLAPVPVPEGFEGELRPYQERGLAWLAWLHQWGLGACLADDMGLGKTIQALALFQHARNCGVTKPILLVCPLSIITNWVYEASRFTPGLKVLTHYGADRAPGKLLQEAALRHDLVVTSYTLLCRDFAALNRVQWSMVVLDEAQNIKNPATLQSRAARSLSADFRLALTGTPVENQVGDLWALMDFLNPGLLGTHAVFNKRFQRPIRTGVDTAARTMLREITAPFILRRLKRAPGILADLPERVENKVFCSLTSEQAALYAAELRRLDEGLDEAEGAARRGLVLATLTRLKQICNHPMHYEGGIAGVRLETTDAVAAGELPAPETSRSGKLARFAGLIEEVVGNGECALVFTQYAVMGALLQNHLRELLGREIPFLHGGVRRDARTAMIARFQSEDGPPVFILSLKAGGTGLNLTRANHVFHYDRWWNPAVENQATDRVHRIGQTRGVFVHKFICTGTLESRIDALIESKLTLAEDIVGSGESWLAQLSNDRLREVLALSADAVAPDEERAP
jgi:superfamily II DNA or RNA helicase